MILRLRCYFLVFLTLSLFGMTRGQTASITTTTTTPASSNVAAINEEIPSLNNQTADSNTSATSIDSIIAENNSNNRNNNVTEERNYFPVPTDTVNDTAVSASSAEGSAISTNEFVISAEGGNQSDTTADTSAPLETEETTALSVQEDENRTTAATADNATEQIPTGDSDNSTLTDVIADRAVNLGNDTDELANTTSTGNAIPTLGTNNPNITTLSNVNTTNENLTNLTRGTTDNSNIAAVNDISSLEVSDSIASQVSGESSTPAFTSTTAPAITSTATLSTITGSTTSNSSGTPQQGFSQSSIEVPFQTSNGREQYNTTVSKRPDPTLNNGTILFEPQNNGTDDSTTAEGLPEPEIPVGDGVEGESEVQAVEEAPDGELDMQTQIYILSGTLGGLMILLIIIVLALALSIARLKDQIQNRHQRYIPSDEANNSYAITTARTSREPGEQIHAYDNSGFSGAHEMEERKHDSKSEVERMGYEMYNGKSDKSRAPAIPSRSMSPGRPSSNFVDRNARLEEEDIRYAGVQAPRAAGDRMSRDSHQLHLEDSVVPIGPNGGSTDRRDYRRGNPAVGGDRYRY